VERYHPWVKVSFQKNAWLDTDTNVYGLSLVSPVHDRLRQAGHRKIVQFEDNLSAHLTDEVKEAWKQHLPHCTQFMFPVGTTDMLQPVDRHIGVQYKRRVYHKLRHILFEKAKTGVKMELTAQEKRIAITHAIGEMHLALAKRKNTFERAFTATATWLKLDRSQDIEVKIEGLSNYQISDVCTEARIQETKMRLEGIARERALVAERSAAEEKAREDADRQREESICASAAAQGAQIWPSLNRSVNRRTKNEALIAIAEEIASDFIVSGSYPALMVAKALEEFEPNRRKLGLLANDIDVYHGSFGDGKTRRLSYVRNRLHQIATEVNQVKCECLNLQALTSNCDINAVQVSVHVHINEDGRIVKLEWLIGQSFWHFLLEDSTMRPISSASPAATLVRLAYKAMQHPTLDVNYGQLSCLSGHVFQSHKDKLQLIEQWSGSPFDGFRLVPQGGKSRTFVFRSTTCARAECTTKSNLKCIELLCATHCHEASRRSEDRARCGAHNRKDRRVLNLVVCCW
jgi:hypothetical protein